MLRRHSIFDGSDPAARGVGETAADDVMRVEIAKHPAATVIPDQCRKHVGRGGAGWTKQANTDRAQGTWHGAVARFGDILRRRLEDFPAGGIGLASLIRGQGFEWRATRQADHVKDRARTSRIDRHYRLLLIVTR